MFAAIGGGLAGAMAGLCLVAWAPCVNAVAAADSTRGDARPSPGASAGRAPTSVAAVLAPAPGIARIRLLDEEGTPP